MFDIIVDTAFCYKRELIVCSFLQGLSKGKGSTLQLTCNAHTMFWFVGQKCGYALWVCVGCGWMDITLEIYFPQAW